MFRILLFVVILTIAKSFAATSQASIPRDPFFDDGTLTIGWTDEPGVSSYKVVIRKLQTNQIVWNYWHYATYFDLTRVGFIEAGQDYSFSVAAPSQSFETITFRVNPGLTQKSNLNVWTNIPRTGAFRTIYSQDGIEGTFSVTTPGKMGAVQILDSRSGAFRYTPYTNAKGKDTFLYRWVSRTGNLVSMGIVEVLIFPKLILARPRQGNVPLPPDPVPTIVHTILFQLESPISLYSRVGRRLLTNYAAMEIYFEVNSKGDWEEKISSQAENFSWISTAPSIFSVYLRQDSFYPELGIVPILYSKSLGRAELEIRSNRDSTMSIRIPVHSY